MKAIIAILALSLVISACSSTGSRSGITVYYQDEADGQVKSYQLDTQNAPGSTQSLCDLCRL